MAALLVGLTVMSVLMTAALPVWTHFAKREKEEELIWRGQQYARAIGLFQRKFANTFPPNVDVLVEQKFLRKKYKDPITGEDFQIIPATGMPGVAGMPIVPGGPVPGGPMPAGTAGGAAGAAPGGRPTGTVVAPTAPPPRPAGRMTSIGTTVQAGVGIQGVVSKSTANSIKIYNGRTRHNEWAFVYMQVAQGIQGGGAQRPGLGPDGKPLPPGQMPGSTFKPLGGTDRRPGVSQPGRPGPAGGQRPASPFGPPSPFGQPRPFETPRPGQPPPRPPGN
jgi:type II secretory pathway pseudopilin PulG